MGWLAGTRVEEGPMSTAVLKVATVSNRPGLFTLSPYLTAAGPPPPEDELHLSLTVWFPPELLLPRIGPSRSRCLVDTW